ncbi:hypothetical protein AKJ09_04849 [Labilithrix luteola]|uniref:Uncharacterized protein n=1 Tax=Labilithrix luteola TaxID=1391654 RepID=A0A0K1PXC4_9BACT|nr:hypothetical protein AKJ09_04849 [Labilithrix luteola]
MLGPGSLSAGLARALVGGMTRLRLHDVEPRRPRRQRPRHSVAIREATGPKGPERPIPSSRGRF